MKGFFPSEQELNNLKSQLKVEKCKRTAYKLNAIILLGHGWSVEQTGKALMLNQETIRNYYLRYRNGGLDLLLQTHHKGSVSKLTEQDLGVLYEYLAYNREKNVPQIQAFVVETFNKHYSKSGMRDLLNRSGYQYVKLYDSILDDCAKHAVSINPEGQSLDTMAPSATGVYGWVRTRKRAKAVVTTYAT
jgi:transposase